MSYNIFQVVEGAKYEAYWETAVAWRKKSIDVPRAMPKERKTGHCIREANATLLEERDASK